MKGVIAGIGLTVAAVFIGILLINYSNYHATPVYAPITTEAPDAANAQAGREHTVFLHVGMSMRDFSEQCELRFDDKSETHVTAGNYYNTIQMDDIPGRPYGCIGKFVF